MQVGRVFFVVFLAAACGAAEAEKKEPMGLLPSATTTAEPSWVPFGIRAGRSVESDARETRLVELRQLTFDGATETFKNDREADALLMRDHGYRAPYVIPEKV